MGACEIRNICSTRALPLARDYKALIRGFTADRQPPKHRHPGRLYAGKAMILPEAVSPEAVSADDPRFKALRENEDNCLQLAERAGNKADSELTKTRHQSGT